MADMATGISKFSLLSSEEATDWSEQVLQASALWQRRAKGVDFYTLGAAHYLDLNPHQTTDHYQALVHRYNPSLWERFGPLYWRLAHFCADYFGGSFGFHENLALPGFHIFGPKPSAPVSFFNAVYFRQGGRVHSHPLPELLPSLLGVSKRQLASSMFSLTLALGWMMWKEKDLYFVPTRLAGCMALVVISGIKLLRFPWISWVVLRAVESHFSVT